MQSNRNYNENTLKSCNLKDADISGDIGNICTDSFSTCYGLKNLLLDDI